MGRWGDRWNAMYWGVMMPRASREARRRTEALLGNPVTARSVTHHEASHAVMLALFGMRIRAVCVDYRLPQENPGCLAPLTPVAREYRRDPGFDIWYRQRRTITCLAGPLASLRVGHPVKSGGGLGDERDALCWAAAIGGELVLDGLRREADRLLGQEPVWSAVEAVAAELLAERRLAGAQILAAARASLPELPLPDNFPLTEYPPLSIEHLLQW